VDHTKRRTQIDSAQVLRRILGPKGDGVVGDLMMETARSSETFVSTCKYTRIYHPKDESGTDTIHSSAVNLIDLHMCKQKYEQTAASMRLAT
jgi:hypothetical protein